MSTDTSAAELALIVERAAAASAEIARLTPRKRARLLDAMARALETHSDALVPIAARESHLPEARLRGNSPAPPISCGRLSLRSNAATISR